MECKKTQYSSENRALEDIGRIKAKSTRAKVPIGAYLCKCGFWHLTSQPNWNDKIKELELVIEKQEKEIELRKQEVKELKEGKLVDDRIKIYKQQLTAMGHRNKKLQEDNRELICKILKYEK